MFYKLPSVCRIKQSKEFEQAFINKGSTNKWFTMYLINSNHPFPRLGMIVSKRTISKSVTRNFAKRLIRETFRLNSNNLPSLDFFIRIRRKLSKNTSSEAKEALLQLMLSTKVL